MAATMNPAAMITKVESSERIGEPLQNASTAATISARAESAALTSFGMAIAHVLPSIDSDRDRRRLVGPARCAAQVLLHKPRVVAVQQMADEPPIEIGRAE